MEGFQCVQGSTEKTVNEEIQTWGRECLLPSQPSWGTGGTGLTGAAPHVPRLWAGIMWRTWKCSILYMDKDWKSCKHYFLFF